MSSKDERNDNLSEMLNKQIMNNNSAIKKLQEKNNEIKQKEEEASN